MKKAYVGGTLPNSLSNGAGTRFVIFFEGCTHKCHGCHNEHLWEKDSQDSIDIQGLCNQIEEQLPLITGVTLSGGDPFMQAHEASLVAKFAHSLGLNVWTYTGHTYEMLEEIVKTNKDYRELMNVTDVLVDGKYDEILKTETIKYIGSTNQRIIKLKEGIRYE